MTSTTTECVCVCVCVCMYVCVGVCNEGVTYLYHTYSQCSYSEGMKILKVQADAGCPF